MGIFSEHAVQRVKQRTRMSLHDILNQISHGGALDMGTKPGIPKRHILFYSQPDDRCYVAIQDEYDGTIITVLPIDYHANLAWAVTPEMEDDAKVLFTNAAARSQVKRVHSFSDQPLNFFVSCRYFDAAFDIKTKKLFSVAKSVYEGDAARLVHSKNFKMVIAGYAMGLGIMPTMIDDVFVRIGANPRREIEIAIRYDDLV